MSTSSLHWWPKVHHDLRNLLDQGLTWGEPLLRMMVMWVALLGAMAATRDDNHIRIDLSLRFLEGRARLAVQALTGGFSAAICALLAWHGARFVWLDWEAGVRAFGDVPAWACEAIMPFGAAVMAIRYALHVIWPKR